MSAHSHDDVIEDLRLYGGALDGLADVLVLSPENREWLRQQRLAETADDRHARALCDSRLMQIENGIEAANVRLAAITTIHYGGIFIERVARVVIGDVTKTISEKADSHAAWIRSCPRRLAKHMKAFPKITQKDLR